MVMQEAQVHRDEGHNLSGYQSRVLLKHPEVTEGEDQRQPRVLMDACSHPRFFGCTSTTIFPCCSALFSRFQPHALFQNGIQDFFWHSGGDPGAWGAYKMGQGTAYPSTMWLVLKRWRPNTDKKNLIFLMAPHTFMLMYVLTWLSCQPGWLISELTAE